MRLEVAQQLHHRWYPQEVYGRFSIGCMASAKNAFTRSACSLDRQTLICRQDAAGEDFQL